MLGITIFFEFSNSTSYKYFFFYEKRSKQINHMLLHMKNLIGRLFIGKILLNDEPTVIINNSRKKYTFNGPRFSCTIAATEKRKNNFLKYFSRKTRKTESYTQLKIFCNRVQSVLKVMTCQIG